MTGTDDAAVRDLILRFGEATDVGTIDEYAACLTAAATMVIGDAVARTGRDEIVAAMESSRAQNTFGPTSGSIHVIGPSDIDVDGDRATASTPFTFSRVVSGEKQVVGAGRYADTFERMADGWRLAYRRIDVSQ